MLDQQFFLKNKKAVLAAALSAIILAIAIGGCVFYRQIIAKNKAANNGAAQMQDPNANILAAINGTQTKEVRSLDEGDHAWGSENAPVQLIFYGDFDCPFSAVFSDTLKKVEEEYKDKVKIGFRHYPLRTHSMALPAALAAECAAEQGKFKEMYDQLFADKKNDEMSVEKFNEDAKTIGLAEDKFKECMDAEKYKDIIQSQWQEASTFNVIGTPGIFVGKEQLSGAIPWDNYKDQNEKEQEGLKSVLDRHLNN